MPNPFFYGTPIDTKHFLNRQKTISRVVSRILNGGQSTAIVGEPRMGKTSLLEYLASPENCNDLYSEQGNSLIFKIVDIQMLSGKFNQSEFWEQALVPIVEKIIEANPDTLLAKHYQLCRENQFGTFTLERFFKQLQQDKWRLVLLMDEFDLLLHHPVLNSAEFFGSLRALVSRSCGALAVVIASRQSLATLNFKTQEFNPTGSPYFNIFAEVNLGAFPNKDVAALLNRADTHFSSADRRYIVAVAGGHPYLLQVAASAMWDETIGESSDPYRRYLSVGQRIYQEVRSHFADTWRVWSPATRKAVTTIAIAQVPYLLKNREFLTQAFIKGLPDFSPEINDLKTIGLVAEDDGIDGCVITQGAMLWWLADELLRTVRNDTIFESWLRDQEFVGLLTRKEISYLNEAAKFIGGLLQKGAVTMIEAFAKEFVS